METRVIYICGLTDYEKEEIRKHKGECRHCQHFDGFLDHDDIVDVCSKGGKRKILLEEKNDCKDWTLDMR